MEKLGIGLLGSGYMGRIGKVWMVRGQSLHRNYVVDAASWAARPEIRKMRDITNYSEGESCHARCVIYGSTDLSLSEPCYETYKGDA